MNRSPWIWGERVGAAPAPANRGRTRTLGPASGPGGSQAPRLLPSEPPPAASRDASTEPEVPGLSRVKSRCRRPPRVQPQGLTRRRVWEARGGRCYLFPVRSAPGPFPPFVARVLWSLCMRSLAWAGHGDHVAGTPEEARVPGTSSARTARSSGISPSISAAARGALLGTPASRGGLARSAANSRRVSRESKLKEHGDV